jgi:uncharacterized protein YjcR
MSEDERPKLEPMYTPEDIAELMGISKSQVYALKRRDGWPCFLIGVKIRFSEEHLEAILKIYAKEQQQQPGQRRPRIGTRANRRNK